MHAATRARVTASITARVAVAPRPSSATVSNPVCATSCLRHGVVGVVRLRMNGPHALRRH